MESCPVMVVIGAAGGIGSALSRKLSARGYRLILGGRNPESLAMLAGELGAHATAVDASKFDQVESVFNEALEMYGRVDGAANCAGSLLLKPAHLTSEAEFDDTIGTSLKSAFAVVRSGAKAMISTGGSVVLVSSVAARFGLPNHEAIAAAKAGVEGLTLSAAATYARWKIRVNCVAPGLVRTPLTKRLTATEQAVKASAAMHPLGRIGEPEDVASAMAWLLDPAQSWITGQVLGVDGGMGSVRPPAGGA
jgi:NAD(P)-dependent dehydrogenase (short-subunit alcohol dehydrogenase family)